MRVEWFTFAAIYLATGIVIARHSRWRSERRWHQLVVALFWPLLSTSRIVSSVVDDVIRGVDALFASAVWSMFCIYIAAALASGWHNDYQQYQSAISDSDAQMHFFVMVMKATVVFALWVSPFVVTAVVWSYRALVDSVRTQ